MRRHDRGGGDRGFTLVEVLFALAILVTAAACLAPLFLVAVKANLDARDETAATALAVQRMEQLRSLGWGCRELSPSPADALQTNTPGYVDYLDRFGNWVGTGVKPPPTAHYVRRWSIEPLPADPDDMRVLQVLVTTVASGRGREGGPYEGRAWANDGVRIVGVRTRKSP